MLDFSANVSPLGLPQGVAAALAGCTGLCSRYPDPLCRALCDAIGEAEGVPAEWVLCGNGAADVIWRAALALKPARALVTAPAFAEYQTALESVGCRVEHYFLRDERDFVLDEGILEAIRPGVEMVFLCEPNNPTGRTTPRPLLERDFGPLPESGGGAGGGRVLRGLFGGPRRPHPARLAGRLPQPVDFEGLHQDLRDGRGPAGLRPLCR